MCIRDSLIRDESGKIKYYEFKVLIRDKAPLTGRLTRDEMNTIYRMYSCLLYTSRCV